MVKTRVILGLIMLFTVIGGLWIDLLIQTDIFLNTIVAILVVLGLLEFYRLFERKELKPAKLIGCTAGAALIYLHWMSLTYWGGLNSSLVLQSTLIFILLLIMATIKDKTFSLPNLLVTCLGLVYIALMMCFLVRIRFLQEYNQSELGVYCLGLLLAVSKGNDIFAFFVGRKIGKHKLMPAVSPNKSIEGAIAGLIAGVIIAVALSSYLHLKLTTSQAIIYGLIVGLAAQFGDLLESFIKRKTSVKDSSSLLPGFGGILDIIDCLLISAPVSYYLTIFLLD